MNGESIPSTVSCPTRASPLEREVLVLQGAAGCLCILGMGALLLAAQTPIHWQAGQLARLIGLLWAVPATVIMTYRHALQGGNVDDPATYLERMRLVRRAALAVLLLAVPWAQWEWHTGANSLFSADLLWPMALSAALCWGLGRLAEQVVQVWFLLHAQDWEDVATLESAGLPRVYPRAGMIDRDYLIGRLWLWWLVGGLEPAGLVAAHGFAQQMRYAVPFGWWVAGFLGYLVLGPLLIGQATQVRWRTQWHVERVRVAPGLMAEWGQVALSATLLALVGAGLLLGGFVLAHDAVVWAGAQVHLPVFTPSSSTSAGYHAVPSAPAHARAADPTAGGGRSWALLAALGEACTGILAVLVLLLLARLTMISYQNRRYALAEAGAGAGGYAGRPAMNFLALVAAPLQALHAGAHLAARALGAIWWSRTQRRGTVSRWAVLAAMLLELGRYGTWLLARLRRKEAPTRETTPARSGAPERIRAARKRTLSSQQPSEAVVALYRRSADLAARHGRPRRPGQTPHEHAREVAARYPEAGENLQHISDVFVEARFAEAPARAEHVQRLAEHWKLLRRALRRASLHNEG